MSDEDIYGLGLFEDGAPAAPPISPQDLIERLLGKGSSQESGVLKSFLQRRKKKYLDVIHGVDVKKLSSAGWGVVLHENAPPEILEALKPLLERRKQQAGRLYQCLAGKKGYKERENKAAFLKRFESGSGPVNPEKLPYYLLLVGSPKDIPFRFQTQLDVQFAVGRIHFDHIEAYSAYAQAVVDTEIEWETSAREQKLALWAPNHDRATRLGNKLFMKPLREALSKKTGWRVEEYFSERATKANLKSLMGGKEATPLLISLCHGLMQMSCIKGNEEDRQINQGALICGDWLGDEHEMEVEYMLRPKDLDHTLQPRGLIWLNFSCFSGGTPVREDLGPREKQDMLAEKPFVNGLSRALLGHANGGALAVIGHVERLWLHSFKGANNQSHCEAHSSMIKALMDGYPAGAAVEHINQRYAELATDMMDLLDDLEWDEDIDPKTVTSTWCAHNDARGYIVIGDPAVRMPVGKYET